jgi:hypothetical protein
MKKVFLLTSDVLEVALLSRNFIVQLTWIVLPEYEADICTFLGIKMDVQAC